MKIESMFKIITVLARKNTSVQPFANYLYYVSNISTTLQELHNAGDYAKLDYLMASHLIATVEKRVINADKELALLETKHLEIFLENPRIYDPFELSPKRRLHLFMIENYKRFLTDVNNVIFNQYLPTHRRILVQNWRKI